jgi:predicted CXXCH cytochrome family protein
MNKKLTLLATVGLICLIFALVACAPQQTSETPTDGNETTVVDSSTMPDWSSDSDCSFCHTAEVESGNGATATYTYHVNQQNMACSSCHTDDEGTLTKAHKNYTTAKLPEELRRSEVSTAACSGCHRADDLKMATAALTILTDSTGLTINPHDLPTTETHTAKITCASCHKMHSTEPVEETAPEFCIGCHHENIYACGTCH